MSYPIQRKTNTFVVIPAFIRSGTLSPPYSSCYLLSEDGLTQWKHDNASIMTIVGNNIIIRPENFANAITSNNDIGFWNAKYYTYPGEGLVNVGITLTDLGKDVYVGVPGEPNILHLRLVQAPGSINTCGKGGLVGYIPIECNSDIFDSGGDEYPNVSVARLQ